MNKEEFLSLRIGFTGSQSDAILNKGIEAQVQKLLSSPLHTSRPEFIRSDEELLEFKEKLKTLTEDQKQELRKQERKDFTRFQCWWLNRIYTGDNPLQEKMVLFWHNHFVSSFDKVKNNTFLYQQNELFRTYAFGNFKELTQKVLYNNAMIKYLDNDKNDKEHPNENLSRELLELFTLGIGNYSETDIKEGARALAGLDVGAQEGMYRKKKEDNGIKEYLGASGNLKANDLVDAIFNHPKASYRISEKMLKFFLTDNPTPSQVEEYAQLLKTNQFEMKPLIIKLFSEMDDEKYNGSKIKDPLTYILQTLNEAGYSKLPYKGLLFFLRNQEMMLMNPPNVKGWEGGRAWLDSGKLISRNAAADALCNGSWMKRMNDNADETAIENSVTDDFNVVFRWDRNSKSNLDIIKELSDRLLFQTDSSMQKEMEDILKYDFNPQSPNADDGVKQLARFIFKTPEYQIL